MNFQSISYFIVLAREKNFTRTAEKLHMTQQALSASMASLEKEWGMPFFLRHVPLELTNGGRVFYEYALRLADEEEELRRALSDVADDRRGTLRIGTGFMREREIMPALVRNSESSIQRCPLRWWKAAIPIWKRWCGKETWTWQWPVSAK